MPHDYFNGEKWNYLSWKKRPYIIAHRAARLSNFTVQVLCRDTNRDRGGRRRGRRHRCRRTGRWIALWSSDNDTLVSGDVRFRQLQTTALYGAGFSDQRRGRCVCSGTQGQEWEDGVQTTATAPVPTENTAFITIVTVTAEAASAAEKARSTAQRAPETSANTANCKWCCESPTIGTILTLTIL